jgi:hypothetical protein
MVANGKIPYRESWLTYDMFLPFNSLGRVLSGYSLRKPNKSTMKMDYNLMALKIHLITQK